MPRTLPVSMPRDYQVPLFEAMDSGYKRAVCVWHRRAGKDKSLFNLMVKKTQERVGQYYYFYPTYAQGRKAIWEGIGKDGRKLLDDFPQSLRSRTVDQQMMIECKNGSIFRVVGSDQIDSIMSTNPVGVVFSEYSLQNPAGWRFVRPILAENGGWAVFNYTPRGNNHGKRLWDTAQKDKERWFSQMLTVDDTGVISAEELENERKELFEDTGSDGFFMQEYYCSFDAPVPGAYYGIQMLRAKSENRIGSFVRDATKPVHTAWDLGLDDSMTCWMYQLEGERTKVVGYKSWQGKGLSDCIAEVKNERSGWLWGAWVFPHDIVNRELMSGQSRLETVRGLLGTENVIVAPKTKLQDGINKVRQALDSFLFDDESCEDGVDSLSSYAKEFVEKNGVFRPQPRHDWASHGADGFRYLVVALDLVRQWIAGGSAADGVILHGKGGNYEVTPAKQRSANRSRALA